MIVAAVIIYCLGALIVGRGVLVLANAMAARRKRRNFPRGTVLTRRQRRNLHRNRADLRIALGRGGRS